MISLSGPKAGRPMRPRFDSAVAALGDLVLDPGRLHGVQGGRRAQALDAGGPAPLRFAQKMSTDWFNPELFVALCSEDMNGTLARLAKYKSGPVAKAGGESSLHA